MSAATLFRLEALDKTTTTLQGLVFAAALQESLQLGGSLNVAFEDNRARQAALLGLSGALEIVVTPLLGRLSDVVGRRAVLTGSAGCMAATRLLTGVLGSNFSPAALDLVLVTALSGSISATARATLADFAGTDKELADSLLKVSLAGTAGSMIGPALGMAIAHYTDSKLRAPYLVSGLVASGVALASLVALEDKSSASSQDEDVISWSPFALGSLVAAVPSKLVLAAALQFVVATEPARQAVETLARVRFGLPRPVLVKLYVAQAVSSLVGLAFALYSLKKISLRQFTIYATSFKVLSGLLVAAVPLGDARTAESVLPVSVLLDTFALKGLTEAEARLLRARPGHNGETAASLSNLHAASSMLASVAFGALSESADPRLPLILASAMSAAGLALLR